LRRWLQLNDHLCRRLGQELAGTQIPRHAVPAPRIDEQPQRLQDIGGRAVDRSKAR
jgi:hypothetical protein